MTPEEHYREAERILAVLGAELDAVWSQALATRALAHATLAGFLDTTTAVIPDSITQPPPGWDIPGKLEAVGYCVDMSQVYGNFSGADDIPEKIVYQGRAVAGWHEKNGEFTQADRTELHKALESPHEPGDSTGPAS